MCYTVILIQEYGDWYMTVDWWTVTFGTAKRGLGGLQPRPVPSPPPFLEVWEQKTGDTDSYDAAAQQPCSHSLASARSLQHIEVEPVSRGDNGYFFC